MALGIVPLTAFATLAALVTALVAPYIGLAIVAFMATLLSPSLVPAPGFAAAMVAAVLLGCVYRLPIERPRLRLSAPIVVILAILVFVTVQQAPEMLTGYATEADHGVGYLYLQLLSGFGAVIASIWLLRDRSPLPVLAMVIAGAVTGALIAILPYLLPSLEPFVVHVSGVSDDLIRASGTFSNPNYMAGSAAIALTLTVSLLPGIRSRAMQGATLASAIALGGAVLISLSRGGLITALVGLLAVGLTRGRRTAVVVLVIGLVGALVIYPAFVDWRLTNLTGSASAAAFQATSDSDAGRLEGALAGVALFLTSPLFGVGFGHYLEAAAQIPGTQVAHAAHNWYTYLLGEQGVVGRDPVAAPARLPGRASAPSAGLAAIRRVVGRRGPHGREPVPGGPDLVPDIRGPGDRARGGHRRPMAASVGRGRPSVPCSGRGQGRRLTHVRHRRHRHSGRPAVG